jgi:hypothetical protein
VIPQDIREQLDHVKALLDRGRQAIKEANDRQAQWERERYARRRTTNASPPTLEPPPADLVDGGDDEDGYLDAVVMSDYFENTNTEE